MLDRPKIVIDARMVGDTPHGFARYVSALALGLSRLGELPYEAQFLVASSYPEEKFYEFKTIRAASGFLSLKELIEIPRLLRKNKANAYHSPSFSSFFKLPCPYAVTVHDLNHLKFGSLGKRIYYRFLLRPFLKRAFAKITVSKFSQGELSHWTGLEPGEFKIVYNAFDSAWMERLSDHKIKEILDRYGLKKGSYFYCVSNPKPHKNIPRLVDAYRSWRLGESSWPLVLTLRGFENEAGVRCLGGLTHEDGRALLQGAGAVLFPSLYEGFGLPPVEASLSGVRLAVSEIPPHREALEDLKPREALWVDPLNTREWTLALEKLFQAQLEPASSATCAAILARFSIEKMARRMDQIYRDMLGLKT